MPLALAGSLTAVQFRYPAELLLALNKIDRIAPRKPRPLGRGASIFFKGLRMRNDA